MPFTKQHSAYAWVVTCILFLINLTFHNLPLHSSYKIHQPFTDYFLRLPYSELLEKRLFRSRANRRLVWLWALWVQESLEEKAADSEPMRGLLILTCTCLMVGHEVGSNVIQTDSAAIISINLSLISLRNYDVNTLLVRELSSNKWSTASSLQVLS